MLSLIKQALAKKMAKKLGPVEFKANSKTTRSSIFEGQNTIFENARVLNCHVGFGTYIGCNSELECTKIGKFSCVGPNVFTAFGSHPTSDFVSIHPAFFSLKKQAGFTYSKAQLFEELRYSQKANGRSIYIGNDVWIGAGVTILDGVTINDGAVIAAGTIVYKDVQPFEIVCGSPMRTIRKRFSESHCEYLLNLKWWDRDAQWIKEMAPHFTNINTFISNQV